MYIKLVCIFAAFLHIIRHCVCNYAQLDVLCHLFHCLVVFLPASYVHEFPLHTGLRTISSSDNYILSGTGTMRVASCKTASGYFASWNASQHVIGQLFLEQLAVYPVRTQSCTAGIFVSETTRHIYSQTQHVCML